MNKKPAGWTLITGGAKRLGAILCTTLAKQGHSIVVHYNNSREEALQVVGKCRALGVAAECIQGDLSSTEATANFIKRYLKKFPKTTTLINNVGNYLIKPASTTTSEEWLSLFQTNLHAPTSIIQALLPSLKKHQGRIVNIGTAGVQWLSARTYTPAYYITKTSLWMLTKSLATELGPFGVTINMVSPGILNNTVDPPKDMTLIPMRRMGTPEEVARVVAFLLEEGSGYITGQNIDVAGGIRL